MTMESFATSYPVMFHDGEKEHNKGYIGVHSVLTFKRFQSLLCQKVGLPSGQITAVFVCRRTSKDAVSDVQEKLPINENTNFSIILNQHNPKWEKDCHFLVTAKKWKKERKGTIGRRRSIDQEESGEEFMICHSKGYSSDPVQKDVNLMAGTAMVNCINTKQSIASETMSSSANVEDLRDIRTPDDRFERMPLMTGSGYNYVARNMMVDMQQSVDHLNLNGDPQQLNLSTDGHGSSEINNLSSQTKQELNHWSHGADNYANLQCMSNSRFNNQKASQERRTRPSLIPDNLSSTASLGVPENHQGIIMSSDSAPHANLMAPHHVKLLNRPDQKILLTRGDQQAALMNPSSLMSTMATNVRLNEKAYSMEKQLGGANMASILPRGPGGVCSFYPRQAFQDGVKPWLRHHHTVDQPTVLFRDDHGYKPWQSGHYHHNMPVKASEEFQERYSDPLLTTRPSLIQARDGLLKPINVRKDDQMMHPSLGFPATVGGNNNNVFLLKNPGPVATGTDLQQAHAHYWGYHPMNNPMIPHRQSLAAVDLHPSMVNSKPGVNVTLDMSKITGLVCSLNSNYQANVNRKSSSSSSTTTTTTTGLVHGGVSCQQCYKFQQSKINPPPFHLCVQDKITVGFRGPSPAGPIGRPAAKTSADFIAAA